MITPSKEIDITSFVLNIYNNDNIDEIGIEISKLKLSLCTYIVAAMIVLRFCPRLAVAVAVDSEVKN